MPNIKLQTTSSSFQYYNCYAVVLTPFQNLGRWLDELITKVAEAVSLFFNNLGRSCFHCTVQPFRNLGRWLQRQINRIASCCPCLTSQAPTPATPREPRRKIDAWKRLTPAERLNINWPRYAAEEEAKAATKKKAEEAALLALVRQEEAAGREEAGERQASAADIFIREIREGMPAAGYDYSSPLQEGASADPERHTDPVRRRPRQRTRLRFSTFQTPQFTDVFCSQAHKEWYERIKDTMPVSVSLFLLFNFDEVNGEAETNEVRRQNIYDYIKLSYFLFLLIQTQKDLFEIHRLFRSLTPQRQQELIQAHAPEIVEWDGHTIPEELWENPQLQERMTQILAALNLE